MIEKLMPGITGLKVMTMSDNRNSGSVPLIITVRSKEELKAVFIELFSQAAEDRSIVINIKESSDGTEENNSDAEDPGRNKSLRADVIQ